VRRGDALVHGQENLRTKVIDQRGNIFPALAQRRHLDAENIQPVEKVGAELAFLNQLLQILLVAAMQRKSTLMV
jgi:hypothetical protein